MVAGEVIEFRSTDAGRITGSELVALDGSRVATVTLGPWDAAVTVGTYTTGEPTAPLAVTADHEGDPLTPQTTEWSGDGLAARYVVGDVALEIGRPGFSGADAGPLGLARIRVVMFYALGLGMWCLILKGYRRRSWEM